MAIIIDKGHKIGGLNGVSSGKDSPLREFPFYNQPTYDKDSGLSPGPHKVPFL